MGVVFQASRGCQRPRFLFLPSGRNQPRKATNRRVSTQSRNNREETQRKGGQRITAEGAGERRKHDAPSRRRRLSCPPGRQRETSRFSALQTGKFLLTLGGTPRVFDWRGDVSKSARPRPSQSLWACHPDWRVRTNVIAMPALRSSAPSAVKKFSCSRLFALQSVWSVGRSTNRETGGSHPPLAWKSDLLPLRVRQRLQRDEGTFPWLRWSREASLRMRATPAPAAASGRPGTIRNGPPNQPHRPPQNRRRRNHHARHRQQRLPIESRQHGQSPVAQLLQQA